MSVSFRAMKNLQENIHPTVDNRVNTKQSNQGQSERRYQSQSSYRSSQQPKATQVLSCDTSNSIEIIKPPLP